MRLAVKLFRDAQVIPQQGSSSRRSRRNRGFRVRGVTRLGVRAVCERVDSTSGVRSFRVAGLASRSAEGTWRVSPLFSWSSGDGFSSSEVSWDSWVRSSLESAGARRGEERLFFVPSVAWVQSFPVSQVSLSEFLFEGFFSVREDDPSVVLSSQVFGVKPLVAFDDSLSFQRVQVSSLVQSEFRDVVSAVVSV